MSLRKIGVYLNSTGACIKMCTKTSKFLTNVNAG